jgi:hypothetical protein
MTTAQGAIVSAMASGSISLTVPAMSDTVGPVPVPTYPGYLDITGFLPTVGTAQYMAESLPAPSIGGSGPVVPFIVAAPPSFTPTFLAESAGLGFTATLVGHVDSHYVLDGGGLAPSGADVSYPYIWAAGPSPGSLVTIDIMITFHDAMGVFGALQDMHYHAAMFESIGSGVASAGPQILPALPPGDPSFDVHATFTLTALSAPGDGGALIKMFGIPEPSTLVLAAIGLGCLCFAVRRQNR